MNMKEGQKIISTNLLVVEQNGFESKMFMSFVCVRKLSNQG